MLKSETKTINGTKYKVTQLPYGEGHRLLIRLLKALGPAVAQAVSRAPDVRGKSLLDLSIAEIAPAFAAGAQQLAVDLNEDDFDHMVETLGSYTTIIGEKGVERTLNADEREFRFAGNYGELFGWLGFALRLNYLNFSGGREMLRAALARAQETQASQSQTT